MLWLLLINRHLGRTFVLAYFEFQLIIVLAHIHPLHVKDVFRVAHATDDFIVVQNTDFAAINSNPRSRIPTKDHPIALFAPRAVGELRLIAIRQIPHLEHITTNCCPTAPAFGFLRPGQYRLWSSPHRGTAGWQYATQSEKVCDREQMLLAFEGSNWPSRPYASSKLGPCSSISFWRFCSR
jgi:hypothetical protein